jgi:hypothetical protein
MRVHFKRRHMNGCSYVEAGKAPWAHEQVDCWSPSEEFTERRDNRGTLFLHRVHELAATPVGKPTHLQRMQSNADSAGRISFCLRSPNARDGRIAIAGC